MEKVTTVLTRETKLDVWVYYEFYPATRGARETYGLPLEPDEPPSIEIHCVCLSTTGDRVEITEAEYEEIENKILDSIMN